MDISKTNSTPHFGSIVRFSSCSYSNQEAVLVDAKKILKKIGGDNVHFNLSCDLKNTSLSCEQFLPQKAAKTLIGKIFMSIKNALVTPKSLYKSNNKIINEGSTAESIANEGIKLWNSIQEQIINGAKK